MADASRRLRLIYEVARVAVAAAIATLPTTLNAGHLYYSYDALGRVTSVCNALPNDGELTSYGSDLRDNRTSYSNSKTDFSLGSGDRIYDANHAFQLKLQTNGNMTLTQLSTAQTLWQTNTAGSGGQTAYFQSDGNFVIYSASGSVWSSGTSMYPCSTLTVRTDGNVVIAAPGGQVVWSTNTGGH